MIEQLVIKNIQKYGAVGFFSTGPQYIKIGFTDGGQHMSIGELEALEKLESEGVLERMITSYPYISYSINEEKAKKYL